MAEDSRIQIKGGNYIGKMDIKGDYNHQQIDQVEAGAQVINKQVTESSTVEQTVLEIQNLLVYFSGETQPKTTAQKMAVATQTIEAIERKPELKGRVVSALTAGGLAAFDKISDHPAASFVIEAVKDWQDTASGDLE